MAIPKVEKPGDGINEAVLQEQRTRIESVRRTLHMGFAGENSFLPKDLRQTIMPLVDALEDAIGTLTMTEFERQKQVIMRMILDNSRNNT